MPVELGKRLENLRESKGWNKTYVSKKIGLKTMQTYANYEYGSREPDLETLKELAELYGVSVDYLLGKPTQTETVKTADIDEIMIFQHKHLYIKDLLNKHLKSAYFLHTKKV